MERALGNVPIATGTQVLLVRGERLDEPNFSVFPDISVHDWSLPGRLPIADADDWEFQARAAAPSGTCRVHDCPHCACGDAWIEILSEDHHNLIGLGQYNHVLAEEAERSE